MNNGIKGNVYYAVTFAVSMVYRMIQIAGAYQMRIAPDDIGMLAAPAYMAGYDWSDIVATTNYYGAAYYIIFTPVLKFVKDPCAVWAVIVTFNIVLVSLACVISYHIAVRYIGFEEGVATSLIAVWSAAVIVSSNCMSQEGALFFLTWLITFILAKMSDNKRKKYKIYLDSVVLIIICMYAYLVHSRAIVLVIALMIVFILRAYYDRKKIKYLCFFVGVMVIGLIFATALRDYIISVLWIKKETTLGNVSISVGKNTTEVFFSFAGVRVLIDMFISNLFTAAGKTLGLNIVAICVAGLFLLGTKIKKYAIQMRTNETLILFFSLACYLIGLAGVCVVWGKSVVSVYFTEEVVYQYKGFSYFRYAATFLGPAAMVGLAECIHNPAIQKKVKWPVFLTELFIIVYYLLFIVQRTQNSPYANNALVSYFNTEAGSFNWINCQMTIVVLILPVYYFFGSKKILSKEVMLSLCIFCNLIPYMGNGFITRPQLHTQADAGYYLIRYLEKKDVLPDEIYCSNSVRARYYQYHLKEYPIILGYPSENSGEILLSNSGERTEGIPKSFKQIRLDDNEWVWMDDKVLYEVITNYKNQKEVKIGE